MTKRSGFSAYIKTEGDNSNKGGLGSPMNNLSPPGNLEDPPEFFEMFNFSKMLISRFVASCLLSNLFFPLEESNAEYNM